MVMVLWLWRALGSEWRGKMDARQQGVWGDFSSTNDLNGDKKMLSRAACAVVTVVYGWQGSVEGLDQAMGAMQELPSATAFVNSSTSPPPPQKTTQRTQLVPLNAECFITRESPLICGITATLSFIFHLSVHSLSLKTPLPHHLYSVPSKH